MEMKQLNLKGVLEQREATSPKALWLQPKTESPPHDTPCTYWNKDVRDWWLGPENIGQTLTDGKPVTALTDNGA